MGMYRLFVTRLTRSDFTCSDIRYIRRGVSFHSSHLANFTDLGVVPMLPPPLTTVDDDLSENVPKWSGPSI